MATRVNKAEKFDQQGTHFEEHSQRLLGHACRELARVEKRDWELWSIALITSIALATGLLVVIFPAVFMRRGSLHLEVSVSRELFLGLIVLVVLFNTYLFSKRLELRRVREELISTTIQGELFRLQSLKDPLTEVYNRRSLNDLAERFIRHALRLRNPLTFLMVDVNRFKEVNTRFGHLTGDFVLSEVASMLRSAVRGSDAVVRYGGDEFIVILADTTSGGADTVIKRIKKCFDSWNDRTPLLNFELSVSIGVSEWKNGQTLQDIVNQADQEMYSMKRGSD
jgi:diguanylate cyclase (GGDEF)-like protein